jgi:predicted nucleotidyltransferase
MSFSPEVILLQSWLTAHPEFKIALIYGSFAKGNSTPQSDIDLALAEQQILSVDRKFEITDSLSKLCKREIDLIDLRVASGVVLNEALGQGLFLKSEDPLLLASILKRMWLDNEDFEKQRQWILAERRKRVLAE